jgi:hypothetical protein
MIKKKFKSADDAFDAQFEEWAKKVDTDWESLAKNLQDGLEKEIQENETKQKTIDELILIVHYLETKLGIHDYGNDPV